MLHRLKTSKKVVGAKQTIKALEKGIVEVVYVAQDADERITRQIFDLVKDRNIPVVTVDNMVELGKECNVEVRTAAAAIIY